MVFRILANKIHTHTLTGLPTKKANLVLYET